MDCDSQREILSGLRFLRFKEPNAVLVPVYLGYPRWFVSIAVLLVDGGVGGVQQPQHGQPARLGGKVSRSPSVVRPQTRPCSMLNEDPDRLCKSCGKKANTV